MAESRIPKEEEEEEEEASSAGTAREANPLGGAGGIPGMPGMPDLAGMMNNPMMMQMAQQLMANGGLERLMQNPSVANMVRRHSFLLIIPLHGAAQMNRMQSGGGMPSMSELMSDPSLRDL